MHHNVMCGAALAVFAACGAAAAQDVSPSPPCRAETVVGRITQGEAFSVSLTSGLTFRLEPQSLPQNPPGWTIRVTPPNDPTADYSMVATPPYRFWNPRYLDTSYGVTAAEALGRTPREFRFVGSANDYVAAQGALDILLWPATHTEPEINAANEIMERLPTFRATLRIEDGVTRPPTAESPLGQIEWLSFRLDVCDPS